MKRLALLISGGGTTAEAILRECQASGRLNGLIEPVLVIASNPNAKGIERAIDTGAIEKEDVIVIEPKSFNSPEVFGQKIIDACQKRKVDLIGQYGWMVKTPKNVIQAFPDSMTNQHPGPLDIGHPDFGGTGMYGERVHFARLYFVQKTKRDYWTEATAQRVHENFDEGKVIKTKRMEIFQNDTVESIQKRLLAFEHEVQIEALMDFGNDNVQEIVREERLVRPGEETILEEAKRMAQLAYPKKA